VFFNNLGTIMLYAIVVSVFAKIAIDCHSLIPCKSKSQGTLMNVFLLGPTLYFCSHLNVFGSLRIPLVDAFTFATLICAVDPVAVKSSPCLLLANLTSTLNTFH
jgi:hypothetical protein